MNAETMIENVQAALQRRFRLAGRGSVNRVQEELNLGAGYFKNQRRSGRRRVDLKILFRALDSLGVDPAEFFAAVLGPADPVDSFKTEAATLRRQARQLPAILVQAEQRRAAAGLEEVDLAALETLRNENPRAVVRCIRDLVPRVGERELPALLGVYASACRALGKIEEAQMVLAYALDVAADRDEQELVADLLQRSSYVMNYADQAEKALALSEKATLCYINLGDLAGIGKTLVDQGVWHGCLGNTDEQIGSFRSALSYLPASSERPDVRKNRFSCLMNLGITYRQLGDLQRAGRFAAEALEVAGDVGSRLYGKLVWLQAAIARETGRVAEAERLYRQALEILRPVVPIDAALSSVELVRFQLEEGRTADAYRTAKAMMVLVQPMERHRIAGAALMELLRCALAGRGLSAAFLDRVARGLERGRLQRAAAAARPKR